MNTATQPATKVSKAIGSPADAWPLVSIGELMQRSRVPATVEPDENYQEITVKLWGRGVVQRRSVSGSEIAGTRYLARTDQFIISRIDARNGASGLVTPSLDGAIVTNDFPLFDLDQTKILPRYVHWLGKTKRFIDDCIRASEGTTNRVRLKEDRFLRLSVPVPSLNEQRRIAARIDELVTKIDQACELTEQATSDINDLTYEMIREDELSNPNYRLLENLVSLKPADVHVDAEQKYQFAGVYCFGRGVFKGVAKLGKEFRYPKLSRLQTNDFVYPKLMAWEGAFGVVPQACNGMYVSTEYPVFKIDESEILPEVLHAVFKQPQTWEAVAGGSTGTNLRRRRLKPQDFLAFKIHVPSKSVQEKVRLINQKLAECSIQTEVKSRLDALIPSILDLAFKGEL